MNLGLTLIGSLLFLAPGLAIYISIYRSEPPFIRKPLLSSGSVVILALAPAAAALIHGFALVLFLANTWVSDHWYSLPFFFDPNPYPTFTSLIKGTADDVPRTAWSLIAIGLIPLITAALSDRLIRLNQKRNARKYGEDARWPGELDLNFLYRKSQADENRALIATVFLKNPISSATGGWVGVIDEHRVDRDGALISISLTDPSYFDMDQWDPSEEVETDAYQEHTWPERYSSIIVPASEIQALSYFVSLPPIHATSEVTLDDMTVEARAELGPTPVTKTSPS